MRAQGGTFEKIFKKNLTTNANYSTMTYSLGQTCL